MSARPLALGGPRRPRVVGHHRRRPPRRGASRSNRAAGQGSHKARRPEPRESAANETYSGCPTKFRDTSPRPQTPSSSSRRRVVVDRGRRRRTIASVEAASVPGLTPRRRYVTADPQRTTDRSMGRRRATRPAQLAWLSSEGHPAPDASSEFVLLLCFVVLCCSSLFFFVLLFICVLIVF